MDFGRQPKPVAVQLFGDPIDVRYWMSLLMQRAEFKGDATTKNSEDKFTIWPRAVND